MSQVHIRPFSVQILQLLSGYLFPPALTPLPKEYISTPLWQRHRFLSLSPEDPVEYLCWPNPDSPSIIEQLCSLHFDSLQRDQIEGQTVYSVDAESIIARVPIDLSDCHIQLLFLYDPEDVRIPWKYHDVQLLPILSDTHPTVEEAVSSLKTEERFSKNMDTFYPDNAEAFWEGYDSTGPSSPTMHLEQEVEANPSLEDEKAEREYWARYSDVQGAAESTNPSSHHPRQSLPTDLGSIPEKSFPALHRVLNKRETPAHEEIAKVLSSLSGLQLSVPNIEISNGPPKYEEDCSRDATEVALHGIYRMWKLQNPTCDESKFLSLVERAIR